MKKSTAVLIHLSTALLVFSGIKVMAIEPASYAPDNPHVRYTGRIDFSNPIKPRLSGAGAYFQLKFKGSSCQVLLEDQNLYGNHNYIATVLDGAYQGRIRVSANQTVYTVVQNVPDSVHTLIVCKATEAQIGYMDLLGISCREILPWGENPGREIEFIGNSITCGMGLETSAIPCDAAKWYDQHNAYLSYAPLVARELKADWLLSSVSGIGITRNWNSAGPTMPQVYNHTFLDTDSSALWSADRFVPDLISICLGTNDFSDGDGTYERAALDSATFVNNYIRFVKFIRNRYPHAQICCLSSPMLSPEKTSRLTEYLSVVTRFMREAEHDDMVHLFIFSRSYTRGCSGHPDEQDHRLMAEELLPFFKNIMNW
jgi:lysophospholipase L1-like esterase